jgi:hypothetical protein
VISLSDPSKYSVTQADLRKAKLLTSVLSKKATQVIPDGVSPKSNNPTSPTSPWPSVVNQPPWSLRLCGEF